MDVDTLALRFRQWADREIAFLDRMLETETPSSDTYRAERAAIRRTVAWIEIAADVPADQQLRQGGTRRDRHTHWADTVAVQEARAVAAELEAPRVPVEPDACCPAWDELLGELAQAHP